MSSCHTFRPVPGQCGPRGRGPLPAPPFDPQDYWATRKLVSSLFGTLETSKLDKSDVVDPSAAAEDGKAADAKKTKEELTRISGVASDAKTLAESKADKLSDQQLEAVNSGIDADKVAKIVQNESAISAEVSRATTEEARLRELINAIKTFDAVVADSLPIPSEQYGKKLYLVPSTNPETQNVKDEFICVKIADSWSWEQVGSTAITIEFDDEPTEGSQKAARSGGIWSWVKSLLPRWLTSDYAEPATVASVAKKADRPALPVTAGNFAALTADGGIKDSLMNPRDFARTYELDGYLPLTGGVVNGVQIGVIASGYASMNRVFSFGSPRIDLYEEYNLLERFSGIKWYYGESEDPANEIAIKGDVSGLASSKADKTTPSADGNLAALTADGNLADSYTNPQDLALKNQVNGMADSDSGFVSGSGDGLRFEFGSGEQRLAVLKGRVIVDRDGKDAGEQSVAMLADINYATKDKADRTSLAPEYSATSAYSVGAFVYYGGNIYQCKTAIADGGEAWNAEHWELRKLGDFFTNSNSLLTGTIDARLPYPLYAAPSTGLLKDRAINTTSLASVTVPDNFTDLLVRASVASSIAVTMPTAITTKYGDTFPGEAGEYLITITKTGAAEAYVRTIKLEEVANA